MVKVILSGDDAKSAVPLTADNAIAVLALALGEDPGTISLVPTPDDPSKAWLERAQAYNSTYLGPVHWVRFINILAATGSTAFAARHSGVTPARANLRRERYVEFAKACLDAIEFYSTGVLERAASQRAIDGVDEPVFHKGMIIGYVRKFSDTLLAKLLEGNLPDKYRPAQKIDASVAHKLVIEGGLPSAPVGGPLLDHAPEQLLPAPVEASAEPVA